MDRRPRPDPGAPAACWRRRIAAICILPLAITAASCAQPVDFKAALELTDVSSGWLDAGIVSGRNKVVPSVTLRFKKRAPADIDRISLNALFRAADGKASELDNDVFVQRVNFEGDQTPPVTLRAENGYTAEPPQSRADMLKHSLFRDMRVQILVKQGSSQWTDMGWIDVKRQLIVH
jgi:hypothetical protein